jgi:hypothetical protein
VSPRNSGAAPNCAPPRPAPFDVTPLGFRTERARRISPAPASWGSRPRLYDYAAPRLRRSAASPGLKTSLHASEHERAARPCIPFQAQLFTRPPRAPSRRAEPTFMESRSLCVGWASPTAGLPPVSLYEERGPFVAVEPSLPRWAEPTLRATRAVRRRVAHREPRLGGRSPSYMENGTQDAPSQACGSSHPSIFTSIYERAEHPNAIPGL